MRFKIGILLVLSALAVALAAIPGGAGANKITGVTTIVHDTDSAGATLLLRSDDYNGSGQATYPAAVGGYLTSDGRYFLRLYGQTTRTLFITPNDPINASQPMAPPPGYYWQNVELAVACHDQSGNQVAFPNVLNPTGNCIMILDFGYNGTEYKLAMGPNANFQPTGAGSGLVNVTCNSVSNGVCVNWTITPNMTASSTAPPTVANLYRFTGSHQTPLALVGQYYLTFRIDVTNP